MSQGQLFDPDKQDYSPFGRNQDLSDRISGYVRSQGLPEYRQRTDVQASRQKGTAVANAYKEAQAAPESPTIRRSYAAMREHVNQQYDYLTKPKEQGGMGVRVTFHDADPNDEFTDAHGARQKLGEEYAKGHLPVFKTASTGGHAFFTNEENDKFRAVHDVFGHMATGSSFTEHGEETAYHTHRQMFPPEAHEALASETRGQNSYANFNGGDFHFPDQTQKLVGLPSWVSKERINPPSTRATRRGKLAP